MKLYLAPLEGITGYIYRNALAAVFEQPDKFFTPFIGTSQNKKFSNKEVRDINPENNKINILIPQLMTKQTDQALSAMSKLKDYGYTEVNINAGCPSGTVVSKGRGSGLLKNLEDLDILLDKMVNESGMEISVKTRIGMYEPEEFYEILEIYNKYNLKELIIHPRVREEFYNNTPNLEVFEYAYKNSKNKLCYNGDVNSVDDYNKITKRFPNIDSVMIGRGAITNPNIFSEIRGGERVTKEKLYRFNEIIYNDYKEVMSGDRNLLFKMKEAWRYMSPLFENYEKNWKRIKKSNDLIHFNNAIEEMFKCDIIN